MYIGKYVRGEGDAPPARPCWQRDPQDAAFRTGASLTVNTNVNHHNGDAPVNHPQSPWSTIIYVFFLSFLIGIVIR